MDAATIKDWFERKEIGRIWYLVTFSFGLGLIISVISRGLIYLVDSLIFEEPTPIYLTTLAIQLLFSSALGFYIARLHSPKS